MNVDDKIKQFSDVVLREAEIHRDTILNSITEQYDKASGDCKKAEKEKFNRRFEEEINRAKREAQKEIVVAQADLKRQLIIKRTEQIESIISNVLRKIDEYLETDEYLNSLVKDINENKSTAYHSVVYLTQKDMKHKDFLEEATGVTIMESKENFLGGLKITISDNRIVDYSFKTRLEEEKENFNKIRIY